MSLITAAGLTDEIRGPKGLHSTSLEARKVGNYAEALRLNQMAIELFQQHVHILDPSLNYFLQATRAVYLLEDGRPEEASVPIQVAYQFAKTVPGEKSARKEQSFCLYHMGRCLGEVSDPIQGIAYVKEALDLTDNPLEKYRRQIRIGEFSLKAGQNGAAIQDLQELTEKLLAFYNEVDKLDPQSTDFDTLYEKMDKNTLLEKIIQELMVVHDRLAQGFLQDRQGDKALESLKMAIAYTKSLSAVYYPTQNNHSIQRHFEQVQELLGQPHLPFETFFEEIQPVHKSISHF